MMIHIVYFNVERNQKKIDQISSHDKNSRFSLSWSENRKIFVEINENFFGSAKSTISK